MNKRLQKEIHEIQLRIDACIDDLKDCDRDIAHYGSLKKTLQEEIEFLSKLIKALKSTNMVP